MVEKRLLEQSGTGTTAAAGSSDGSARTDEAKRPRVDQSTGPQGALQPSPAEGAPGPSAAAPTTAAATPGPVARLSTLEALAKAKRALQLQKELKEKMKAQVHTCPSCCPMND